MLKRECWNKISCSKCEVVKVRGGLCGVWAGSGLKLSSNKSVESKNNKVQFSHKMKINFHKFGFTI
jgi:hypothetical protein